MWYGSGVSLKQKINQVRRNYWRDRVLDIGPKLNKLYRVRNGLNPVQNPELLEDVALLDAHILTLERKRDSYLDNIRRTA
jgi:hypothetical protein